MRPLTIKHALWNYGLMLAGMGTLGPLFPHGSRQSLALSILLFAVVGGTIINAVILIVRGGAKIAIPPENRPKRFRGSREIAESGPRPPLPKT